MSTITGRTDAGSTLAVRELRERRRAAHSHHTEQRTSGGGSSSGSSAGDSMRAVADDGLLDLDGDGANDNLGSGSYGVVLRAEWHGAPVAVKHIHSSALQMRSSKSVDKFKAEMMKLSSLCHPHIIQFIGVSRPKQGGVPGIVMEMMACTLRQRYSSYPRLTKAEHLSIAHGVASGLSYLHSLRILHRDLTTNNIMMKDVQTTHAKITDVGLSRQLEDGAMVAGMTASPGNMTYMAPETFGDDGRSAARGGNGHGTTHAVYGYGSDVFSLGVAMLAMCVAREPPGVVTLVRQGRHGDLDELSANDGHPLSPLIYQCLQESSTLRPRAKYVVQMVMKAKRDFNPMHSLDSIASNSTTGSSRDSTESVKQAHIERLTSDISALSERYEARCTDLEIERAEHAAKQHDLELQIDEERETSSRAREEARRYCDEMVKIPAGYASWPSNDSHGRDGDNTEFPVNVHTKSLSLTPGGSGYKITTSGHDRSVQEPYVFELRAKVKMLTVEAEELRRQLSSSQRNYSALQRSISPGPSVTAQEMEEKVRLARRMADRKVQDAQQQASEAVRSRDESRQQVVALSKDMRDVRAKLEEVQRTVTQSQDAQDYVVMDKLVNTLLSSKYLDSHPDAQRTVPSAFFLLGASRGRQQIEQVTTLPKWKVVGQLPFSSLNRCNQPCAHNGYLYAGLAMDESEELTLMRAPLNDLFESSWKRVPVPCGAKWNYHCYLLSAQNSLWLIATNLERTDTHSVFRQVADGTWQPVTRFRALRTAFGVGFRGSTLAVVGGCCGVQYGRDDPVLTPELYDTGSDEWLQLPCLRQYSKSATVLDFAGCLHAVAGHGYIEDNQHLVHSLGMMPIASSSSSAKQSWTTDKIPPLPFRRCGAAVVNNQLVVAGGQPDNRKTAVQRVYLLERTSHRWLELPPLQCAQFSPRLVSDSRHVWCFGGFNSSGHFHRDIEVLQLT
ncbi:mitogen-activated protein kinase kinase kinase 7-like [Sycon ciliatum]|uniref:mitogen-activated protein kinase kinase kinase 7-like n=1 Tax=Sycon ciliatum TaxID=27933 RepID=UPI0031F6573B